MPLASPSQWIIVLKIRASKLNRHDYAKNIHPACLPEQSANLSGRACIMKEPPHELPAQPANLKARPNNLQGYAANIKA
jgi:hypothetical protein